MNEFTVSGYVQTLTLDAICRICEDYDLFEKEGTVPEDGSLRLQAYAALDYCNIPRDVISGSIVLWMRELAFEANRNLARRFMLGRIGLKNV